MKNKFKNDVIEEIKEDIPVVEEPEVIISKGMVNVDYKLNVRKSPSSTAEIITTLDNDEIVIILNSEDENFYKIELANGKVGYAMKKFIENVKEG